MFTSFLVIFTASVISGNKPPEVVASFTSVEACLVAASRATKALAAELQADKAMLSCVTVVYPV
jgi:hypothetical protein